MHVHVCNATKYYSVLLFFFVDGGGFGLEDNISEVGTGEVREPLLFDKGIELNRPSLLSPEEVAKRVVSSCVCLSVCLSVYLSVCLSVCNDSKN